MACWQSRLAATPVRPTAFREPVRHKLTPQCFRLPDRTLAGAPQKHGRQTAGCGVQSTGLLAGACAMRRGCCDGNADDAVRDAGSGARPLRGFPTPATLGREPADRCGGGRPSCVSPCTRAVSRDLELVTTLFLLATVCSDSGAPAVLSPGVVASIAVTLESASLPVVARARAHVSAVDRYGAALSSASLRWQVGAGQVAASTDQAGVVKAAAGSATIRRPCSATTSGRAASTA